MTVWIKIANVFVEPWAMSVVHNRAEAAEISSANARRAAEGAQIKFDEYHWALVHVYGDRYVVEGQVEPGKK
jgi:hypothetical protein